MSLFSSLPLSEEILSVVQELGFEKLTPIQSQSIPILLSGKDLIGQSKTGSGKTAAFAIPILQKINLPQVTPQALILCPTRELSAQVARDTRRLGRRLEGLQVLVLSGGESLRDQVKSLEHGVHIVVGTPGRILDLIERRCLDLRAILTLVMDEADKMLEMGFEDEINAIMEKVPQKRQTVFFSATFPEKIQNLSKKFQQNPTKIIIQDEKETPLSIEQFVYDAQDEEKVFILMRVLQQHPSKSTLIFCNQKATVDLLAKMINEQNVSCAALHGDLEQKDRDKVMAMFRNGSHRILIATDVAARGLDIDHLELVINFDLPHQTETYVHRIGRTGRAGKKGVAVTLAKPYDAIKLFAMEKLAGKPFQRPTLGFKNQHGLSLAFREAPMQTLSISGGRKDKLRPGDILGALTGASGGLKSEDVGKIEIHDRFSYVAISAAYAQVAQERLREGRIKGTKFQVKLVSVIG